MDEELFPHDKQPEETTEGVRIIGAEEAEKAIEREDVARRLPEDAPRYGDRPEGAARRRAAPGHPIPADGLVRPDRHRTAAGRCRPIRSVRPVSTTCPHWTEPATGEVPKVLAVVRRRRRRPRRMVVVHDVAAPLARREPAIRPRRVQRLLTIGGRRDAGRCARSEPHRIPRSTSSSTRSAPTRLTCPRRPAPSRAIRARPASAGRPGNPVAASTGHRTRAATCSRPCSSASALGVAFLLFAKAGPKYVMVLVVAIIAAAAVELFTVMRRAGYHPATLLGIAAAVTLAAGGVLEGRIRLPGRAVPDGSVRAAVVPRGRRR